MNYSTKTKKPIKPSEVFPDLIPHMAEISNKIYELQELTRAEVLGRKLGITKQGFRKHLDKQKGKT